MPEEAGPGLARTPQSSCYFDRVKAPFHILLITASPSLSPLSSPPARSVRRFNQGHAAPDVQEETLLVQGCFFQPAEERFRKTVRNPEIRHQTGQKATGGDAGADRCSSKNGFSFISNLTSSLEGYRRVGGREGGCREFALNLRQGWLRSGPSPPASPARRFRGVSRPGAELSPLFWPRPSRPSGEASGAGADHQCALY